MAIKKMIDLPIGYQCGKYVVIGDKSITINKTGVILCRCECGKELYVNTFSLRSKTIFSCKECYHKDKIVKCIIPIGTRFGNWTVKSLEYKHKTSRTGGLLQHVICDCGYETFLELTAVKAGRTTSCHGCASKRRIEKYKEMPLPHLKRIQQGAKIRGLECNLTAEFIYNLYLQQDGKCALSGVDIGFREENGRKHNYDSFTASLDRIDSSKSYTEDNVQ